LSKSATVKDELKKPFHRTVPARAEVANAKAAAAARVYLTMAEDDPESGERLIRRHNGQLVLTPWYM
jgi:hypothetical protein